MYNFLSIWAKTVKAFVEKAIGRTNMIIIAIKNANTSSHTNISTDMSLKILFVSIGEKVSIALGVQASVEPNTNTYLNSDTNKNLCVNGENYYSFSSAGYWQDNYKYKYKWEFRHKNPLCQWLK